MRTTLVVYAFLTLFVGSHFAEGAPVTPPLVSPLTGCQIWPASGERVFPTTPIPASATNASVDIVSARGVVASASFMIRSSSDISKLELRLSDLAASSDVVFPASNADIRVVKCWYQDANAWFSGKRGQGAPVLVPELLLHDDSLVKVDEENKQNLVRTPGGKYRSIAALRGGERSEAMEFVAADDAPSLLPVALASGVTRQFYITFSVDGATLPALYHGRIDVIGDGKALGHFDVNMRVVSHILPAADSRFSDCASTDGTEVFSGGSPAVLKANSPEPFISVYSLPEPLLSRGALQYVGTAGLTTPVISPSALSRLNEIFAQARPESPWIADYTSLLLGQQQDPAKIETARELITQTKAAGIDQATIFLNAPTAGAAMTNSLAALRLVADAGMRLWIFADKNNYLATADIAGAPMQHGVEIREPGTREGGGGSYGIREYSSTLQTERWRHLGTPHYLYVEYPVAIESYSLWRRHLGLECFWQGFDGFVMPTLVEKEDPWNDWSHPERRSRTLIYPTETSFIPTLAWEGVRDALIDARYLSSVTRLADKNRYMHKVDFKIDMEGRKASMFVDLLSPRTSSLDTMRLDAIAWIVRLEAILQKYQDVKPAKSTTEGAK